PVTMATRSCNEDVVMSEDPKRADGTAGASGYRQRGDNQATNGSRIRCGGARGTTQLAVVDQQQTDGPDQPVQAHEGRRRLVGVEKVPAQHRHVIVGDPFGGSATD